MSVDSTIEFSASWMAGFDGVMAENKPPLLELMCNDDLQIGVDGVDQKFIVIMGERQPLPVVETTTDVRTEYVVVLSGNKFF